ncbi:MULTISPECIES: pyrroloquinoline quinone biosynthesis protein PqqF [Pantoea]|uniref:pyrroloquinoline quinone biosynthesis protein PqqF n=1 Tax=Pantoea TaxID=53335 RepID=UPI0006601476|nr:MULTISPECIES: pyrroloquinoline quinone biosynthesis protein PqqF [Pantoea]MDU2728446.1 pyrroloquinoline quinone biosynthesis protein PqqF [Pantoea sp.]
MTETRQLRLRNGLRVTLIHQPDARQAAALAQVAAGSHDEPDAWPGLAHLLEHLLFSDSARFQGDARLMPWIQAAGGRLNATTLARSSAWFFETEADLLAAGAARLADMLAAPQFAPEAIAQEAAVIDAEYRLIQQHTPSRREAALNTRVSAPAVFQRFHIGSRDAFGSDVGALKQALHQFHQRFFLAGQMQLWLQGPQPLEALEQIAHAFGEALPAGASAPQPTEMRFAAKADIALKTQGAGALWIAVALRGEIAAIRDNVTLIREFLQDEAPGGAMHGLRQCGWAQRLEFAWLNLDSAGGWLALQIETERPDAICAWYPQVLRALAQSSPQQQRHYLRLAQRRFNALTPLDQLRERAFGFPPPADIAGFTPLLRQLAEAPQARLWSAADVQGTATETQGFSLELRPWTPAHVDEPLPTLRFYPLAQPLADLTPPAASAPLLHLAPGEQPATLMLRPAFFTTLTLAQAAAIDRRLRPLFALLRHQGGAASWRESQGVWLLEAQLPPGVEAWLASLPDALRLDDSPPGEPPPDDVAIRELLRRLPQAVAASASAGGWRAALYGGLPQQHAVIAQWLAPLAGVAHGDGAEPEQGNRLTVAHQSRDGALLLFLPCPPAISLAAMRALALLMEPRFFQRLRVERQIGYVVSCRYHRCVDRDGVLFALQSPDVAPAALLEACRLFVQQLQIPDDAAALDALRARLRAQLDAVPDATAALQLGLRQARGLRDLDRASLAALTPEKLRQAQAQLLCRFQRGVVVESRHADSQ